MRSPSSSSWPALALLSALLGSAGCDRLLPFSSATGDTGQPDRLSSDRRPARLPDATADRLGDQKPPGDKAVISAEKKPVDKAIGAEKKPVDKAVIGAEKKPVAD